MWLNLAILLMGSSGWAQAQPAPGTNPYGECAPGGDSRTLKLDIAVDPTAIVPTRSQERQPAAPHTSKVRVTLTNPGPREMRLTFPNPCYLGYQVETPDGAELPQEDAAICIAALAPVTLAPGASETKEFRWTARSAESVWAPSQDIKWTPLPPGQYKIIGTLARRYCGDGRQEPPLRTPPVLVEVRPAAK